MDNFSIIQNISLYKSSFKGREDVYAIHWSKGSKSGYMPAKLYDPYINKVYKKGTNPSSSEPINYLPLTDDQIQRHLEGKHLIGLYPLLQDNTSWLIAADFDKNSWIEDCRRFISIFGDYNIPAYLERSRSGKGGHVWIFFNQPYPAFKSRIIVLNLLERAGIASIFTKTAIPYADQWEFLCNISQISTNDFDQIFLSLTNSKSESAVDWIFRSMLTPPAA